MTQQAWNSPENSYNEHNNVEGGRPDFSKKAAQQAPNLGGWINSVMPERQDALARSGQYQSSNYGVGMGNVPNSHLPPMHGNMQPPMAQQAPNVSLDIHGIYQRLDDLAGTISRMDRAPARPAYSGLNRRAEEYQPYSGVMRRADDYAQYAGYRTNMSAQSPEMISQLIMRVEDAERQAREAWRTANSLMNGTHKSSSKTETNETAISRAERILAAADETARKTLALLAAKQDDAKTIASDQPIRKELEIINEAAVPLSQENAIQFQLSEQLKTIEARLEALAEAKSLAQNSLIESQKNNDLSTQLNSIESRLEALLEEKIEAHAKQPIQEKLEQLALIEPRLSAMLEEKLSIQDKQLVQEKLDQLASIEGRLSSLLEEKFTAHSNNAPIAPDNSQQLASIESRLSELLDEKLAIQAPNPMQSQLDQLGSIEARIESLLEEKLGALQPIISDKSAVQFATIEARLEQILNEKLASHTVNADGNAEQIESFQNRIEGLLAQKLQQPALNKDDVLQQQNEKLSVLFSQLDMVGERLQSLSQDMVELKQNGLTVPSVQIQDSQIAAIVDHAVKKTEMHAKQDPIVSVEYVENVKQQIGQLFNEFENGRAEDAKVLDHLYQEINSIRIQDSQEGQILEQLSHQVDGIRQQDQVNTEMMSKLFDELNTLKVSDTQDAKILEKLCDEISSIRQQDALVYNEIEDISARLENQIEALREQILQPQAPQPPVMEALEDIYIKLDQIGESVDQETHDSMYALMQNYMDKIQQANDSSEEQILQQLRSTYQQIENLAEQVSNIKVEESKEDDTLLINLEHYIHELGSAFAASNQNTLNAQREFQNHLTTIRSSVTTLDQRLLLLSELIENAAQDLRSKPVKTEDKRDFDLLMSRIDELQEKLVDTPARLGLASMEYQLHQLDGKIEQLSEQEDNSDKVQLIQTEILSLKSAIDQAMDMSSVTRLEKEISEIHNLLISNQQNTHSPQPNTRVIGDMLGAISRVEFGISQVVQNNNMDALLHGFDQLNKSLNDQRSTLEKNNKVIISHLNSELSKHDESQQKLIHSVIKKLGEVNEKTDDLSTAAQVNALNDNIQLLHAQIQAEIQALSSNAMLEDVNSNVSTVFSKVENLSDSVANIQGNVGEIASHFGQVNTSVDQISGLVATLNNNMNLLNKEVSHIHGNVDGLGAIPESISVLTANLQDRFSALEAQVNYDLPAKMSEIVKNQLIDGSAVGGSVESYIDVRNELNALRETIEKFADHQLQIQQSALQQSQLHAEAFAHAQTAEQHQSMAEARALVMEARNALQQQTIQTQAILQNHQLQAQNAAQHFGSDDFANVQSIHTQSQAQSNVMQEEKLESQPKVNTSDQFDNSIVFMDEVEKLAGNTEEFSTSNDDVFATSHNSLEASHLEKALAPLMAIDQSVDDYDFVTANQDKKPDFTLDSQPIELDDLSKLGIQRPANESGSKQDFIAAARRAAQAAAAEAAQSSLAVRARSTIQQDPFQQETHAHIEAAAPKKSLLSLLGIAPAKVEKPDASIMMNSPKLDPKYVAPKLPESFSSEVDDELLEPNDDAGRGNSPLKKTLLMSASAAILAAGTFGYFTSRNLDQTTSMMEADAWKSSDVTASIPSSQNEEPVNSGSIEHMSSFPQLEPMQDMNQLFEAPTGSTNDLKPYTDQAKNTGYIPHETIAGIPVPPMALGKQVATASVQPAQTPQEKATTLASLQFPMPIEAIGSQKLRVAAAQGNPAALLEIGNRYIDGKGVNRDINEAILWFTRSANLGSAVAQYRLGSFYEKGYGVSKDLKLAAAWYQKSALAGNRKSMHNLAVLYAEGYQGKPDFELSMKWFREGAERGLADSQYNLGVIYARGLGVKQDMVEAYKWFAIAAEAGDGEALKKRDEVAGKMDPKMLHWAKSAVRLFQPKELDAIANDGQPSLEAWDETPAAKVSAIKELKRVA